MPSGRGLSTGRVDTPRSWNAPVTSIPIREPSRRQEAPDAGCDGRRTAVDGSRSTGILRAGKLTCITENEVRVITKPGFACVSDGRSISVMKMPNSFEELDSKARIAGTKAPGEVRQANRPQERKGKTANGMPHLATERIGPVPRLTVANIHRVV